MLCRPTIPSFYRGWAETHIYFFFFFFWPKEKQKYFISVIEQQHDTTNNMISVPSKDSDQVGHSDFLQFWAYGSKWLPRSKLVSPLIK